MGTAASSGAASTSLAGRPGNSVSSVTNSDKTLRVNGGSGGYSCTEPGSRASASSDNPSPKQNRHVVIQATDPKKTQRGGLMDKLIQRASHNNGPGQPGANGNKGSRATSLAGSQAGSQVGSERIPRNGKRDDYDVDSGDEDLDGFIYDDDSTSEDEREDYVNAFSRKKKAPVGDDYSMYEGAAVRALATGSRKGRVRRTRSSTTDDGDDEWDPEEERIRQLRQQKKQDDRTKAAALVAKNAGPLPPAPLPAKGAAEPGLGTSQDRAAAAPMNAGAYAATTAATSSLAQRTSPHGLMVPQPPRMAPQPPGGPPSRGNSGSNMRRNVAGAAAGGSSGGTGSGGATCTGISPGPGPVPGPGSGPGANLDPQGGGAVPAVRGCRPAPPPAPQVNCGASASSQYWQAKRSQNDSGSGAAEPGAQGMSRLEQLAALQKKRQTTTQEQSRMCEEDQRQGAMRGQGGAAEPSLTGSQPQPTEVPTGQPQAGTEQVREKTTLCVRDQGGGATAARASERQSCGGGEGQDVGGRNWALLGGGQPSEPSGTISTAPTGQQQQQQNETVALISPSPAHCREPADPGPAQRKLMDGQSFIRHLEPPPEKHVRKETSGVGRTVDTAAPKGAPHPPLLPRCSDVTDFDVDEVLNSFSPGGEAAGAHPQEPQQWAGSRPQRGPRTPPPRKDDGGGQGHPPLHKRSIRAVQSDFTSMGLSEMADGVTDLAGRVLSLPLPATRPTATGPQAVLGSSQPAVMSAPVAVSRFARMGATMLGQSSTQDGGGIASAPLAVAGGRGGQAGQGSGGGGTAAPALSAFSGPSQVAAPSPMRRPRRSTASSDGVCASIPTSFSAPPSDTIPRVSVAGQVGSPGQNRDSIGFATYPPAHMSVSGDNALVLPILRPGSGGGGRAARGSDMGTGGSSILNTVGRSRFGVAQHQQFQQEVARSSMTVVPTPRDYDSDSALTKAVTTAARFSCNGAGRGQVAAGSVAPGSGFDSSGAGVFGAAARSRLGQVGA
ncbi:hypothetical protein Vafri_16250 [Volvox africanus]|uniref:Uncharacterized protein n=1 Tax=Volvox africanus TaxID=51714 RepID=A0A8J4BGU3_9CHLO|nr:hypothetical protein Vafri_16250 [Volvox africanus]